MHNFGYENELKKWATLCFTIKWICKCWNTLLVWPAKEINDEKTWNDFMQPWIIEKCTAGTTNESIKSINYNKETKDLQDEFLLKNLFKWRFSNFINQLLIFSKNLKSMTMSTKKLTQPKRKSVSHLCGASTESFHHKKDFFLTMKYFWFL